MSESEVKSERTTEEGKEATFLQFLSGMGAQTLMHLGQMENPMTGGTQVDLANAKYSIDLLGILEEKTRGNLNEEESNYLDTMLTQLRLSYVSLVEEKTGVTIKPGEESEAEAENEEPVS